MIKRFDGVMTGVLQQYHIYNGMFYLDIWIWIIFRQRGQILFVQVRKYNHHTSKHSYPALHFYLVLSCQLTTPCS